MQLGPYGLAIRKRFITLLSPSPITSHIKRLRIKAKPNASEVVAFAFLGGVIKFISKFSKP